MRQALLTCLGIIVLGTVSASAETLPGYTEKRISGWTIVISNELLKYPDESKKCLSLLEKKLDEISGLLPSPALAAVRGVKIWMEWYDPYVPGGLYHVSRQWLVDRGQNLGKLNSVEFGNALNFLSNSAGQPMMVLHELAHAYKDQALASSSGEIQQAFNRAENSHMYSSVPDSYGAGSKAYALEDVEEYFAELTEAYFGINDFYPFWRYQLQFHDPEGYALIEKMWKVPRTPATRLPPDPKTCSYEGRARSIDVKFEATVGFRNKRKSPIRIYWINFNREKQLHATIAAGQSVSEQTYLTHPWMVTDLSDKCLAIVQAQSAPFVIH